MSRTKIVRSPRAVTTGLAVLSAVGAVAAPVTPVAAAMGTYVVDGGSVQCPDAQYTSIQAAVDAASPGSRVVVCPGRYTESVVVAKTLILEGRGVRRGTRCVEEPSSPLADPDLDAIVTGADPALSLQADDVVLDGFVVEANVRGLVAAPTVSGYEIRHSLFQHNSAGIVLGSSGDELSVVRQSCFRDNARPSPGPLGPIPASAIVNLGGPRNALIERNSFVRNTFGIRLGGGRDVTINGNASLEDGAWLRMGGTQDLTVSHNHIGAGPQEGMLFFPQGGQAVGAPNRGARITHNTITDRGLDGFRAQAGVSSLVDSVLSHNRILGNGRDGIRIEAGGNVGNRIEHNHLLGNGEHDCHDDSTDATGAGPANVWLKNIAVTENVQGLCARPLRRLDP